MDDPVVRVVVIAALSLVVIGVALATRRWQRPTHPPVDVSGVTAGPAIVVFTSTGCARCTEALAIARESGVAFREVPWESEPGAFTSAGVSSVPLTVVVDPRGVAVAQFVGAPSGRRLRRVIARNGLR